MICLWLSAGAVLDHTDDLSLLGPVRPGGPALVKHAPPFAPPGPCAACEWIQAAGPLQVTTVTVACVLAILAASALLAPRRPSLSAFHHILLRGPPLLSA